MKWEDSQREGPTPADPVVDSPYDGSRNLTPSPCTTKLSEKLQELNLENAAEAGERVQRAPAVEPEMMEAEIEEAPGSKLELEEIPASQVKLNEVHDQPAEEEVIPASQWKLYDFHKECAEEEVIPASQVKPNELDEPPAEEVESEEGVVEAELEEGCENAEAHHILDGIEQKVLLRSRQDMAFGLQGKGRKRKVRPEAEPKAAPKANPSTSGRGKSQAVGEPKAKAARKPRATKKPKATDHSPVKPKNLSKDLQDAASEDERKKVAQQWEALATGHSQHDAEKGQSPSASASPKARPKAGAKRKAKATGKAKAKAKASPLAKAKAKSDTEAKPEAKAKGKAKGKKEEKVAHEKPEVKGTPQKKRRKITLPTFNHCALVLYWSRNAAAIKVSTGIGASGLTQARCWKISVEISDRRRSTTSRPRG